MPHQPESYQCPICTRSFKRNEHLARHLRTHTQERPFSCPLCEKTFTRQDTLKRHVLGHADSPSSDNCKDESQVDDTQWSDFDQFLNSMSNSVDLGDTQTNALQWLDVDATTQVDSGNSFSGTPPSCNLPGAMTDGSMFLPTSESDSAITTLKRSFEPTSPRHNSARHSSTGSFNATNLNQPKDLKLPPELFNSMIDDYARKWLRQLCKE